MATESPLIHDGSQTVAAASLTTSQFYAIYGILQNKPASGQAADVGFLGVSKAIAGAAITAGAALMTDTSGRLITATSTNHRVGYAIESVSATNTIFTMMVLPGAGTA